MKRILISIAYALAGLVLAVGLTAGAYAIGGRELSKPARPFQLTDNGDLQNGEIERARNHVEPDDAKSPEDSPSPDDKSGSGSNSGSGSSNSGSGSSNSGSGSGDDEPDDD